MADNSILSRLDGLKLKYEETGQKLTDPEVIADVKQFVQLNKEYKELEPIIETSERYRTALANLAEAKDILSNDKDEEMREMARGEITELEPAIEQMEEQIKLLLIPKDPQDSKNAIMEIRGGTGGDEAAIFAGDLLRMYTKYIESKGWRYEMTSFSDGAADLHDGVLRVLRVLGDQQQLDLLLHLLDGGFQLGDLPARHFAHLLVLVVGEDVLGFGEVGQSRAVTFRGLDDRFQLLVLLVELYELLDVGDDFGVGEFLSRLLVFQFQAVETAQNGVVCHKCSFCAQRYAIIGKRQCAIRKNGKRASAWRNTLFAGRAAAICRFPAASRARSAATAPCI